MTNPRPLTPLERAILRAVVELGDEAYRTPIFYKVSEYGVEVNRFAVVASLWRLENEKYLKAKEILQEKGKASSMFLWRPAFDLTEVLKG